MLLALIGSSLAFVGTKGISIFEEVLCSNAVNEII